MVTKSDVSRRLEKPDRRYLYPVFQQGQPVDDAVLTEIGFNLALLVRNISNSLGQGTTPGADDWTVKESAVNTSNNFTLEGGSGGFQDQKVIYASGLPAVIIGDMEYNSAASEQVHAASDALEATRLFDAGLNLEPGELVGRALVPNIKDGTEFTITANSKNAIEVGASDDMTVVASGGDRYRVELSTPSGSTRTDVVYLDIYISEISSQDDASLLSNVSGVLVETARRKQIQQVVRVRENVGTSAGQFPDPVDPNSTDAELRVFTDERGQRHGLIKLATFSRPASVADIAPSIGSNLTTITDARPQGFARTALDEIRDFTSTSGAGLNFKKAINDPDDGLRNTSFSGANPFATLNGDLSKLIDQTVDVTTPALDTICLELRSDGSPTTGLPTMKIDAKRKGEALLILTDDEAEEGVIIQQSAEFPCILLETKGTTSACSGLKVTHATPGVGIDLDVSDGDGLDINLGAGGDTGARIISASAVAGEALLELDDNTVATTSTGIDTLRITKTGASGTSRGNILDLTYDGSPDVAQTPICLDITMGVAQGVRIANASSTLDMMQFDQDASSKVIDINKAAGTTGDIITIADNGGGAGGGTDAAISISMDGSFDSADRHAILIDRSDGQGPDIKITKSGSEPTLSEDSPCIWLDIGSWSTTPHMVMVPLASAPSYSAPAGALTTALDSGDVKLYINESAGNFWAIVGTQTV